MNLKSDFLDGELLFSELPPKPPDVAHLQGAMFLDRPDLWPVKRRRSRKEPPPEQMKLKEVT